MECFHVKWKVLERLDTVEDEHIGGIKKFTTLPAERSDWPVRGYRLKFDTHLHAFSQFSENFFNLQKPISLDTDIPLT